MSFEDDLQEGMSNFDKKVGEQIEIDATFEELSLAIQNKTGFVLLERTPWRNEIEQFIIKFGSIMLREPSKTKYLMLQHAGIKESANVVAVIYQTSTGYPIQIDIGETVYDCSDVKSLRSTLQRLIKSVKFQEKLSIILGTNNKEN